MAFPVQPEPSLAQDIQYGELSFAGSRDDFRQRYATEVKELALVEKFCNDMKNVESFAEIEDAADIFADAVGLTPTSKDLLFSQLGSLADDPQSES